MLTKACFHTTIKTNPQPRMTQSAPLGAGLLTAIGPYLLVNNIGCNLELSLPAKEALEPQFFFVKTDFAEDPEKSAFDLDMHALIYNPHWRRLIASNHDGLVRVFDTTALLDVHHQNNQSVNTGKLSQEQYMEPVSELLWKGDIEQSLLIGDCLWSSSPIGYRSSDPPEPGLFVSEPLGLGDDPKQRRRSPRTKLGHSVHLAELGQITSITADDQEKRLAIATNNKVSLSMLHLSRDGVFSLGPMIWQSTVPFHTKFLTFTNADVLLAGGYDFGLTEDFTDPTSLKGGGFATLATKDGQITYSAAFERDLAWGNGAQCLTLSTDGHSLLGIDRYAGLHSWRITDGRLQTLFEENRETNANSLGISHATWIGNRLFCGFNREPDQLHVYDF